MQVNVNSRSEGLMDLLLQTQYSGGTPASTYSVEWASNFDGAFAQFAVVPSYGLASPNVPRHRLLNYMPANRAPVVVGGQVYANTNPWVRFAFAPSDYGIPDDTVVFLRVTPFFNGVAGTPSVIYMILTPEMYHSVRAPLLLTGTAGGYELRLPRLTSSMRLECLSGTVEFDFGVTTTPAYTLSAGDIFADTTVTAGTLFVDGGGTFQAYLGLSTSDK